MPELLTRYKNTCLLATFLSLTLLFSGCTLPDNAETQAGGNTEILESDVGLDDTPREDLESERVLTWQEYKAVANTSIRVFFQAQSKRCYGTRAVVKETEATIQIAVIEGLIPGAPDACTRESRQASLLVETKQPIGERKVVPLPNPPLRR